MGLDNYINELTPRILRNIKIGKLEIIHTKRPHHNFARDGYVVELKYTRNKRLAYITSSRVIEWYFPTKKSSKEERLHQLIERIEIMIARYRNLELVDDGRI